MRRITASRLELAHKCLHPWTGGLEWVDTLGPEAAVGTAAHTYFEHLGDADLDALADEKKLSESNRRKLKAIAASWDSWVDGVPTAEWQREVPFAVNPETGEARRIDVARHRDYSSAPPAWITGTADIVEVADHGVVVSDYKTGKYVEAPFVNPQLRFLSVAAATAIGVDRAMARIIKVTTDGVAVMSAVFEPQDLQAIRLELRALHDRRKIKPGPVPGPHCRFCPVRESCPEFGKETTQMAAVVAPVATKESPPRGLKSIVKGRLDKPIRVLMFAPEGIGKSTFASNAPAPIFVGAEDGTAQLDVHRFPQPSRWEDVFSDIGELTTERHDYRTVVIDTLDWLEPLCWEFVCRQGGKRGIEDFGFGKGYVAALEEWRRLLAVLDALRASRGMSVILLAHSKVATFKNPEGDDYDRYTLKLHDKASGVIKEWADAVLFAQYETFTHEKSGRVRGIDSGARVIHTQHKAAYDAKNRFDLPETIPLSWEEFAAGVRAHVPASVDKLREQYAELLPRMPDDVRKKAEETYAKADAAMLAKLVDRMRGRVQIEQSQTKESA